MIVVTIEGADIAQFRQQVLELAASLVGDSDTALERIVDSSKTDARLEARAQRHHDLAEITKAAMDEVEVDGVGAGRNEPPEEQLNQEPVKKKPGFQKGHKPMGAAAKKAEAEVEVEVEVVEPVEDVKAPKADANVTLLEAIKVKVSARYTEAPVRAATKALLANYGVNNFNLVSSSKFKKLAVDVDNMLAAIPQGGA